MSAFRSSVRASLRTSREQWYFWRQMPALTLRVRCFWWMAEFRRERSGRSRRKDAQQKERIDRIYKINRMGGLPKSATMARDPNPLSRQSFPNSLQAFLWPHLFGVVIVLKSGCAFREPKPRHLTPSINVDIRSDGARVVERSDANESDLGPTPVVTPNRGFAFGAPVNVVWSVITGNRHGLWSAAQYPYRRGFDNCIENKCTACVALTIRAVTAMYADRRCQEFVAHLAAGTTAAKFFSHPNLSLVDVLR